MSKIKSKMVKKPIKVEMWLAVIVISATLVSVLSSQSVKETQAKSDAEELVDLSLNGFEQVSVRMEFNDLIFSSECRSVTMTIADTQALSISHGLVNTTYTRPLTHEIIRNAFEVYGIKIPFVRIDRYEDGIYYASIIMEKDEKVLQMDARPSDSVGIAVRTNAPIYFKTELLERFGSYTC